MKRIRVIPAIAATLVALLLAGCNGALSTLGNESANGAVTPIDLSNTEAVSTLCGEPAKEALEVVQTASKANPESGQRNALADWGVTEPADSAQVKTAITTLEKRAETPCKDVTADSKHVGVEQHDGSIANLPLIDNADGTLFIDTTQEAATPPLAPADLLDGRLKFTAQTLTWGGLVERVGDQQWYIDGVNARAAQTGFDWNDVLEFAKVNYSEGDKVKGINALAIQVYNMPHLTPKQVRAEVAKYITPELQKATGIRLYPWRDKTGKRQPGMPIQKIEGGFQNTRNVGTEAYPKMGDAFDPNEMIRVTLLPIKFKGNVPVKLDGSRGAGVFIDCGNLHWQPETAWVCKGKGCEKPKCPPGTVGSLPNCDCPKGMNGTPPNCYNPPEGCSHNCNPPTCKHDCEPLTPKDWSKNRGNEGIIPLETGKLTDGNRSSDQKASGKTSGNVVDNKVPSGTKSNDTTPDLPAGTVTAPGATKNEKPKTGEPVEDTSNDVVDEEATNQNDGGTTGDTEIVDPDG
jgi:hypothetical protein